MGREDSGSKLECLMLHTLTNTAQGTPVFGGRKWHAAGVCFCPLHAPLSCSVFGPRQSGGGPAGGCGVWVRPSGGPFLGQRDGLAAAAAGHAAGGRQRKAHGGGLPRGVSHIAPVCDPDFHLGTRDRGNAGNGSQTQHQPVCSHGLCTRLSFCTRARSVALLHCLSLARACAHAHVCVRAFLCGRACVRSCAFVGAFLSVSVPKARTWKSSFWSAAQRGARAPFPRCS